MTLNDIAKRLGCTYSNASWLLRHGVLHGGKKDGEWIVTLNFYRNVRSCQGL